MSTWKQLSRLLLAGAFASTWAQAVSATETFDVSAYEKRPWEINGYVEVRGEWLRLQPEATGFALQFPEMTDDKASRGTAIAEISGLLRHGNVTLNATGRLTYVDDVRQSSDDARFLEAYASWAPDHRMTFAAGKKALRWGKGYAWSPVAFLERPKDPLDPDLAREAFVIGAAEFVRSFGEGAVTTAALSAVVLPVTGSVNEDYGPSKYANPAGKLYLLVADTDIDLLYAGAGSRGLRYGIDFSRNITSNLEVHGEWARLNDIEQPFLGASGEAGVRVIDASSWLVGLRYLSERDTTVIAEAYQNGAGYGDDEVAGYHAAVRDAASSGDSQRLARLRQLGAQSYLRPAAARNYAYLRIVQKEPFDWLYFAPALTVIGNLGDGSATVTPELTYTGIDNVEVRLRLQFSLGGALTEFGEKAVSNRAELRIRLFF